MEAFTVGQPSVKVAAAAKSRTMEEKNFIFLEICGGKEGKARVRVIYLRWAFGCVKGVCAYAKGK